METRMLYQAVSPSVVDGLHSSGALVSDFKQMCAQNPSVMATLAISFQSHGMILEPDARR
jgi:hypothetical protein